jgi:norsolorinic acid ketoreductase
MGDMESMPIPALAYGISKVSVNYMIRKIHFEHPTLITLASDPGCVATPEIVV